MIVDSENVLSSVNPAAAVSKSPTKFVTKSVVTTRSLKVVIETTVEFDGFMHYSILLHPLKPVFCRKNVS